MKKRKERIVATKEKPTLPPRAEPNSVKDLIKDGAIKQRRIYDPFGRVAIDIDTSDHNKPKYHPMGAHKHVYDYTQKNPHGRADYLTDKERETNQDIL